MFTHIDEKSYHPLRSMLERICEDEPLIAQKIAHFIKQRFPTFSIQLFSTGKATLEGKNSSIYLLNIELQDMNALEPAKQIRSKQQAEIIFITAHEK